MSQVALDDEDGDARLDDAGLVTNLGRELSINDVTQAIKYARDAMFAEVPHERSGMNSTRIAEVLNFRKALPPLVSVAHVHALVKASTKTEREIAHSMATGVLRKVVLSGRGNEISGFGESLTLVADLEQMIKDGSGLDDALKDRFVEILRKNPRATSLSGKLFSVAESTALLQAGYLVSSLDVRVSSHQSLLSRNASVTSVHTVSRAASGSAAAVGGEGVYLDSGGGGTGRRPTNVNPQGEFVLSLPNIGVYIRLLSAARHHLLSLLGKSKFREAPQYLLRERWDGAIDSDNRVSNAKRLRGEFAGILPGRTKKWKQLYGITFEWILEECLGAGLVELFETGSVGRGVRAI